MPWPPRPHLPRTLFGRNLLLIVAIVFLSQLGSAWLYRELVIKPRVRQNAEATAQDLLALVDGLQALAPAERARFVERFNAHVHARLRAPDPAAARAQELTGAPAGAPGPAPRERLTPLEQAFVQEVSARLALQQHDLLWRRMGRDWLAVRVRLDAQEYWIELPALQRRRGWPTAWLLGSAATGLLALLGALLGGLILNVMPCVLPVLSLKALSLAEGGRGSQHARASALSYAAGVMLSFLVVGAVALGLRATGQALGWGFQLQQPLMVAALVYVMFAVGLSLSGVFAVGYGLAGAGRGLAARGGLSGDFFTGVLAVVVAAPCTTPFMGTALAFAFAAPLPLALAVFALLGVGMALPFLLIGLVPGLARRLPRPGAWMDTLKQVLAFPMYLTAVWLLWVLGKQRGIDAVALALAGLVVLALGLWALQRVRFQATPLRRTLALALLVLSIVPLVLLPRLPAPPVAATTASADGSEPYSPARLAQLRKQGRVVFVDMGAAWCVSCKANENAVLDREAFRAALRSANAVRMRGDWTNVDPTITAFLTRYNAVGVPLYVVFPSSGGEGEVLPTILTQQMVSDALQRAARQ